jgi:chromosome partitioning protein
MNVVVFAARKGGSGKSTLTAHLAAHKPHQSCLLIDADPQGSLSLWHRLRGADQKLTLKNGTRGLTEIVRAAKRENYDWVLIDTPPTIAPVVSEAIRAATLVVIPARPTVFDMTAVAETINTCRQLNRPYAVVINGAPARRNDADVPVVAEAREGLAKLNVPLWSGQITNRTYFSTSLAVGKGVNEYAEQSHAAAEIAALWTAIERSVKAINGAYENSRAMHRAAA